MSRGARRPLRRRLARLLPRWWRREEGGAAVEFVLLVPLYISILLIGVEAGMMLARQVMLERAVDIAVRDLRLGSWVNPTHQTLKDRICEHSIMLRNCPSDLLVELAPVDTANWELPTDRVACVDRENEIVPVTQFVPGAGNQLMMVRVCFIVEPLVPTTGYGLQLPLDAAGGFQLRSASTFVNEPR